MDGDVGLLLTFLVTLRRDFLDPSIHLLEYELRSCLLDLGGGPVDAFGGEGGGVAEVPRSVSTTKRASSFTSASCTFRDSIFSLSIASMILQLIVNDMRGEWGYISEKVQHDMGDDGRRPSTYPSCGIFLRHAFFPLRLVLARVFFAIRWFVVIKRGS